ncbi:MAG: AtpZ/AtpI family protein [Pyrinomonadaceae bacterium]
MPENEEQEVTRKSGMAYAAGLTIFFSLLIFLGAGWLLDRWLGTAPWLLVAGIVLGAAVGFYEFVRIISKID